MTFDIYPICLCKIVYSILENKSFDLGTQASFGDTPMKTSFINRKTQASFGTQTKMKEHSPLRDANKLRDANTQDASKLRDAIDSCKSIHLTFDIYPFDQFHTCKKWTIVHFSHVNTHDGRYWTQQDTPHGASRHTQTLRDTIAHNPTTPKQHDTTRLDSTPHDPT